MRTLTTLSIAAAFAILVTADPFGGPFEDALPEGHLKWVAGRDDNRVPVSTNCSFFEPLGAGEVVYVDCFYAANNGLDCVYCSGGQFIVGVPSTEGGAYETTGVRLCTNVTKSVGKCVNGDCVNKVEMGKCSTTPIFWLFQ